jgi:pimeloyl-ACP methyl ester carboxylesterase
MSLDQRPRIFFLHGWNLSADSWRNNEHFFREAGYQTEVLRLPGFDLPMPPSTWGIPEYADFVLRQLAETPSRCTIVVGHSFGGRIAMYLAVHHPRFVDAVVLSSAAGLKEQLGVKQRISIALSHTARALGKFRFATSVVSSLRKLGAVLFGSRSYRNTSEPLRPIMKRIVALDLADTASAISQPTLIIWGDMDRITPLAMGNRLRGIIKNSKLIVVRGAGHRVHETHSDHWNKEVSRFAQTAAENCLRP